MSTWNHSPATGRPYLHGTNGGYFDIQQSNGEHGRHQITTMNNWNYAVQQPSLQSHYHHHHQHHQWLSYGLETQQPSFRGMGSLPSYGVGINSSNDRGVHQTTPERNNISRLRTLFVDGVAILDIPGSSELRISIDQHTNVQNTRTPPEYNNASRLRTLPEDGVAILEIPGFSDFRNPTTQHRNMQLDIDDMSYEEVQLLEERIGTVPTGLSEENISSCLKTRIYLASTTSSYLNESDADLEEENETCIICQAEYEKLEKIGALNCGHEYHLDCIKQWLLLNNICPICRRSALSD